MRRDGLSGEREMRVNCKYFDKFGQNLHSLLYRGDGKMRDNNTHNSWADLCGVYASRDDIKLEKREKNITAAVPNKFG